MLAPRRQRVFFEGFTFSVDVARFHFDSIIYSTCSEGISFHFSIFIRMKFSFKLKCLSESEEG